MTINDLNLNTAFKVAWAGFMRLGEITYTDPKKRADSFKDLHLICSDITFSENDQYATLRRLKRSKTDTNHIGVLIMLAATNQPTCPVTALRWLFTHNPQQPHAPLFAYNNTAFSRRYVIDKLRARLIAFGISLSHYTGHNFRRGAAQHASDNGILDEDIQKLGRWSSDSFRLYFTTSAQTFYIQPQHKLPNRTACFSISRYSYITSRYYPILCANTVWAVCLSCIKLSGTGARCLEFYSYPSKLRVLDLLEVFRSRDLSLFWCMLWN